MKPELNNTDGDLRNCDSSARTENVIISTFFWMVDERHVFARSPHFKNLNEFCNLQTSTTSELNLSSSVIIFEQIEPDEQRTMVFQIWLRWTMDNSSTLMKGDSRKKHSIQVNINRLETIVTEHTFQFAV